MDVLIFTSYVVFFHYCSLPLFFNRTEIHCEDPFEERYINNQLWAIDFASRNRGGRERHGRIISGNPNNNNPFAQSHEHVPEWFVYSNTSFEIQNIAHNTSSIWMKPPKKYHMSTGGLTQCWWAISLAELKFRVAKTSANGRVGWCWLDSGCRSAA